MKIVLLLLSLISPFIAFNSIDKGLQVQSQDLKFITELFPVFGTGTTIIQSYYAYQKMLQHESPQLHQEVIAKVLTTLKCASLAGIENNEVLTVIDYSMPSNEKRLWVFDLKSKKLLFNTYVSHGIRSGELLTNFFSNQYNSKASSIGIYKTLQAYYGRDGLSLRLDGLDRSFNDNAANRAVVMHSGWYVEEEFIKKYGRPGRSWGCPALPISSSQAIINTIKNNSLMVIYYPNEKWFNQSRFLNCDKITKIEGISFKNNLVAAPDDEREEILFVGDGYKNKQVAETKPVAVLNAELYQRFFHTSAPLKRMLRRQINQQEYIALSPNEMKSFAATENNTGSINEYIRAIQFVIPVLKQVHGGYYETQMQVVSLGPVKLIQTDALNHITLYFEHNSPVKLNSSNQFVRWVGL